MRKNETKNERKPTTKRNKNNRKIHQKTSKMTRVLQETTNGIPEGFYISLWANKQYYFEVNPNQTILSAKQSIEYEIVGANILFDIERQL